MNSIPEQISVDEAYRAILSYLPEPQHVRYPLQECIGRRLAEDISSDRAGPPFDRVAMDGIAFNHQDLPLDGILKVCGVQAAGSPRLTLKSRGSCIEAMTGAVLPEGCDCVVPYEQLDRVNDAFVIHTPATVKAWANIHRFASDFAANQVLLKTGLRLKPVHLAVAASCGHSHLEVTLAPRIGILSTGSELVAIDETPLPHQIRRSNISLIESALRMAGCTDLDVRHQADDRDAIRHALKELLETCGMLILSGGVSRGKFDLVPELLEELGVQKIFHRIRQKPGKPFWFGHKNSIPVYALPGNPVSVTACFYRYVKPALSVAMGRRSSNGRLLTLDRPVQAHPKRTEFIAIQRVKNELGTARVIRFNGSGDFAALIEADGFAEIPQGTGEVHQVEVWLWR